MISIDKETNRKSSYTSLSEEKARIL